MECNCQTPSKPDDLITAHAPIYDPAKNIIGWKLAWYARKDCPIHGIRNARYEEPDIK